MSKIGNYNANCLESCFAQEGLSDLYNFNKTNLAANDTLIDIRRRGATDSSGKKRYEFAYIPNIDILAEPYPLNKGIELKISFDRAPYQCALIETGTPTNAENGAIEILDAHAWVDFVSSPFYRNYFSRIESGPINYTYETTDVLIRFKDLNFYV